MLAVRSAITAVQLAHEASQNQAEVVQQLCTTAYIMESTVLDDGGSNGTAPLKCELCWFATPNMAELQEHTHIQNWDR